MTTLTDYCACSRIGQKVLDTVIIGCVHHLGAPDRPRTSTKPAPKPTCTDCGTTVTNPRQTGRRCYNCIQFRR